MKSILCISVSMLLFSCNEPTKKETKQLVEFNKCNEGISLEGYGIVHNFHANPDTVKLNSNSYLILSLYDCQGEMDIKEYSVDSGLILSGQYKAAKELVRGVSENINPYDGTSTLDSSSSYYPTKTGTWEHYNKNGKVIKEDKYD